MNGNQSLLTFINYFQPTLPFPHRFLQIEDSDLREHVVHFNLIGIQS